MTCGQRLRKLGLFNLKEVKVWGETFTLFTTALSEDRTRFILVAHNIRVKGKGPKVEHVKI